MMLKIGTKLMKAPPIHISAKNNLHLVHHYLFKMT